MSDIAEARAIAAAVCKLPKRQRAAMLDALTAWALANYDEAGRYIAPIPKAQLERREDKACPKN